MNGNEARSEFVRYLRWHNIPFDEDIDDGFCRLTFCYRGYNDCPGRVLESCIWFEKDVLQARVYFHSIAADCCRESEHRSELMRLLNYCNARVWPCGSGDGVLYHPNYLHTPRYYVTEDGFFDITMTTMIPYDFFEVAPLETEDFLTAACPDLLNKLSIPIFHVLLGRMSVEQAIAMVDKNVLGEGV